jgi:hypothetical protein
MLTLNNASEADCAHGSQRPMIVAQLDQGVTALPKATEPVVAIGKVDTSAPSMSVTVTELVSGKEAWTHALSGSRPIKLNLRLSEKHRLDTQDGFDSRVPQADFSKVPSRSALYFARWTVVFWGTNTKRCAEVRACAAVTLSWNWR